MSPRRRPDNTNGEPPEDGNDSVMDISMAWLSQIEAQQRRAAMRDIQRITKEAELLVPPGFWKSANEARRRAVVKLAELMEFAAGEPTHQAVQRRIDEIFETIQWATGFPPMINHAMLVMEVLIVPLEQCRAWEQLEAWFLQMYPMLVDESPNHLLRWRQMVILHCKYTGRRKQQDNVIDDLLEDAVLDPNEHGLMLLLRSKTSLEECRRIADKLFKVAHANGDYTLMMNAHAHLANRYLEAYHAEAAFEHAQQAFCLATVLSDGRLLARTAAYMASVFHQRISKPSKALEYANLALEHAGELDDPHWVNQISALRAFCLYTLGQHQEALVALQAVLPYLDPRGLTYARALYIWCAALSFLNPTSEQFDEIEDKLVVAYDIFMQQDAFADILSVQMALVQIYIDAHKGHQARTYYRQVVKPLITAHSEVVSPVHQHYIDVLEKQLNDLNLCA